MKTTFALALTLILSGCGAGRSRAHDPTFAVWDAFVTWRSAHFETNGPTFGTTSSLGGPVHLEVYGLTSTELQDSLLESLSDAAHAPATVKFWGREHHGSLGWMISHTDKNGDMPLIDQKKCEAERRTNLLREVELTE